jgi:hypothetical protein
LLRQFLDVEAREGDDDDDDDEEEEEGFTGLGLSLDVRRTKLIPLTLNNQGASSTMERWRTLLPITYHGKNFPPTAKMKTASTMTKIT